MFSSTSGSSGSNRSWSRTEGRTGPPDFRLGGLSEAGDPSEFDFRRERVASERSAAPPSEGSVRSSRSHTYSLMHGAARPTPGSPSGRHLAHVPSELTSSRRSCSTANGEFFVDIMWLRAHAGAEVPKPFALWTWKSGLEVKLGLFFTLRLEKSTFNRAVEFKVVAKKNQLYTDSLNYLRYSRSAKFGV